MCQGEKIFAFRGQNNIAKALLPDKELNAKFFLQPLDTGTGRSLSDIELVGSAGNIGVFRNGKKSLDSVKIHKTLSKINLIYKYYIADLFVLQYRIPAL